MYADDSFDAYHDDADFVPVVMARSEDEAEKYQEVLEDHEIPTLLSDDGDVEAEEAPFVSRPGITRGVSVMVPETMLDEASEIIADMDSSDAFAPAEEELDEEEDEYEFGDGLEELDEEFTVEEEGFDPNLEDDDDLYGDEDEFEEEEEDEEEPF
ncbi:MAG: hypothetical protein ACLFVU_13035 [Phycisphaerae bacterium]